MGRSDGPARNAFAFAAWRVLIVLLPALSSLGCGYQPVLGRAGTALHVTLVRSAVADPVAADEVVAGIREELARAGLLAQGQGYPRVEVEVLRAAEASEGVSASPGGPVARATDVGVEGRAWVVSAAGEAPTSATGDLRAEDTLAVDEGLAAPDPRASTFHHADALRAAARRLGRALGARLLGLPSGSEETGE